MAGSLPLEHCPHLFHPGIFPMFVHAGLTGSFIKCLSAANGSEEDTVLASFLSVLSGHCRSKVSRYAVSIPD